MRQRTSSAKVSAAGRHAALCGIAVLLLANACFGQAAIQLSSSIGPPTSKTLVSGQNFPPDDKVDLCFDHTKVGQTTTDGTGVFSKVPIQVPKDALPGKHHVFANPHKPVAGAKAPFRVRTDWPQFGFLPSGGRHNPFENVLNPRNVGSLVSRFTFTAPAGLGDPIVAGGMVYINSYDGSLYALSADAGALVWKAAGLVPAEMNGLVYVTDLTGNIYALKAGTGAVAWSYDIGVDLQPLVVSEGTVYAATPFGTNYDLFALDGANGRLFWETFFENTPWLSWPAVSDSKIYVGGCDSSGCALLAVNSGDGTLLWKYPIGSDVLSPPAAVDGVVYAASMDNNVYALDIHTGALLWKYSTTNAINSSPAVADGVVYVGSFDGNVYALDANTGDLLWKYFVGNYLGSPAVADGVVYVKSVNARVVALNAKTGGLLWQYTASGQATDPIVANGMLYFGSEYGVLYAFGLPRGAVNSTSTKPHPHPR